MIIEFKKLTTLLDESGIPNQGVRAHGALTIMFGTGNHEAPVSYDAVDLTAVHLAMDEDGRVISIDLL